MLGHRKKIAKFLIRKNMDLCTPNFAGYRREAGGKGDRPLKNIIDDFVAKFHKRIVYLNPASTKQTNRVAKKFAVSTIFFTG